MPPAGGNHPAEHLASQNRRQPSQIQRQAEVTPQHSLRLCPVERKRSLRVYKFTTRWIRPTASSPCPGLLPVCSSCRASLPEPWSACFPPRQTGAPRPGARKYRACPGSRLLNRLLRDFHSFVSCFSSAMHRSQRLCTMPCSLVHIPPQRSQYFSSSLTISSPASTCPPLLLNDSSFPHCSFGPGPSNRPAASARSCLCGHAARLSRAIRGPKRNAAML